MGTWQVWLTSWETSLASLLTSIAAIIAAVAALRRTRKNGRGGGSGLP